MNKIWIIWTILFIFVVPQEYPGIYNSESWACFWSFHQRRSKLFFQECGNCLQPPRELKEYWMEVLPQSSAELTLMSTVDPVKLSLAPSASCSVAFLLILLRIFCLLLYASLSFSVKSSSPTYAWQLNMLFFSNSLIGIKTLSTEMK